MTSTNEPHQMCSPSIEALLYHYRSLFLQGEWKPCKAPSFTKINNYMLDSLHVGFAHGLAPAPVWALNFGQTLPATQQSYWRTVANGRLTIGCRRQSSVIDRWASARGQIIQHWFFSYVGYSFALIPCAFDIATFWFGEKPRLGGITQNITPCYKVFYTP